MATFFTRLCVSISSYLQVGPRINLEVLRASTALRDQRRIDTFNGVFVLQGPPQPGQPFKFSVGESCDRIKEEFNFLQAQYHRYPSSRIYESLLLLIAVIRRCMYSIRTRTLPICHKYPFPTILAIRIGSRGRKRTSSLPVIDINTHTIFSFSKLTTRISFLFRLN